ncbi:MAG: hypothetical protein IPI11_11945 [Haliscomenobacter sp.]|nr:hypothetical protein [Haliscomenobacter sp.]
MPGRCAPLVCGAAGLPFRAKQSGEIDAHRQWELRKKHLACALENGRCDHDHTTTHGIQIKTLGGTDIRFNVWDFGGQEVYHGTHRLFMEAEALQVILFDPKTEASARNNVQVEDRSTKEPVFNHPIEYWYETASELSPNSQFFLVQNKKDEAGQEDKDIRDYADGKAKFLHLSAKTGRMWTI